MDARWPPCTKPRDRGSTSSAQASSDEEAPAVDVVHRLNKLAVRCHTPLSRRVPGIRIELGEVPSSRVRSRGARGSPLLTTDHCAEPASASFANQKLADPFIRTLGASHALKHPRSTRDIVIILRTRFGHAASGSKIGRGSLSQDIRSASRDSIQ